MNQHNIPNPNSTLNPKDITRYLSTPETRAIFFAGYRTAIGVSSSMDIDDQAFLVSDTSDERIVAMALDYQKHLRDLSRRDVRIIIKHSQLNLSDLRAFIFGYRLNDAGYAVDNCAYVIENSDFQLMEGYERLPWTQQLARNRGTGCTIPYETWDQLPANERELYDIVRYLDLVDAEGTMLKRVFEDDERYLPELIAKDIASGDPVLYRYCAECGAGHGTFATGRFYAYRETIAGAAHEINEHGISDMLAKHLKSGFISSIGQYYLAWLLSLKRNLKSADLANMDDFQLDTLQNLLSLDADNLGDWLSDADVMYFRDVNGNGMKGMVPTDENGGYVIVSASDERCNIAAQKAYITDALIPDLCDIVVSAFNRLEDASEIPHPHWESLISLVESINPQAFEDDEDDQIPCAGDCAGCEDRHTCPNAQTPTCPEQPADNPEE